MIITTKVSLRIAAIVLVSVLLQMTFFSMVEVFHVSPFFLPAVVAVFGLLGGTMTGTVIGFATGLMLDGLVGGPVGVSCLALMGVGYGSGLYRERADDVRRPLTIAGTCSLMTLAAVLVIGLEYAMLGLDSPVAPAMFKDVIIKSVYSFLAALPIYVIIRRVLRPALIEDRTVRRRRQPTVLGS